MDYHLKVSRQAKSKGLYVKLEPARLEELKRLAEKAGLSVSEWIRRAIDDAPKSPASADGRG